ncbi:MAG: acyclic terpene utilization AtuA family protein [Planctomycetota bacterium]
MKEKIVIANCGGFWGDDPTAAKRQVEGGPIDYLVMDYLAEVTMAILQKQKAKNPALGYAADFLAQLRDVLPQCVEKGVKVISNAGGVNPLACRDAVNALAEELGIADRVTVGVVLGDDIYPHLDEILGDEPLAHMDTGRPLSDVREDVMSANVYLGAKPVVEALKLGANVVISGRVSDTGVTLAPMIHEFGWAENDWDRIASGIVAGHIIECGTQCTGGNFTDWQLVKDHATIGYPMVEVSPDGSFVVTKHPGTGGLVSVHTVSEQLLYEMGAPAYIAPDCIAYFNTIQLAQAGPDRVAVSGVRGSHAPEKYKVSISFEQGYRAFGRLMVSGPDARRKAEYVSDVFWKSAGGREHYAHTLTQFVGDDSCHPSVTAGAAGEILLQVAARDDDRGKLANDFAPQLVPKVLSTVPGITYLADQGRPRPSGVVGYWPALISRGNVHIEVEVGDQRVQVAHDPKPESAAVEPIAIEPHSLDTSRTKRVRLAELCLARSGDKGDTCNVGVIARSPAIYHWMVEYLTAERVKEYFGEICLGAVDRFAVPNLLALNFLLHESLGGGGTLSLLIDAQGKTYSQYLLNMEVDAWESICG